MTMTEERTGTDSQMARRSMIERQLRPSGVNEPAVLAAMARVPREEYVPPAWRAIAYVERAIPLGNGRWLAAPLVHGRMLAEAKPTMEDKTLLVGDDQGYLGALLRSLTRAVDAIDPAEAATARGGGGYSLVVIDGAIEELPDAIADQLADDGRLITGLVDRGVTRIALGRKAAGKVAWLPLAEIGIPVLSEFAAPKRWSF